MQACVDNPTDRPCLDVTQIPPHTQAFLAETFMEMYRNFIRQPGGREAIEAEKKRLGLC